jgi:hypothetical protein
MKYSRWRSVTKAIARLQVVVTGQVARRDGGIVRWDWIVATQESVFIAD